MNDEHYTPKNDDNAILEELPAEELTELESVTEAEPPAQETDEAAPAPAEPELAPQKSRPRRKNPVILRLTRRAVLFLGLETLALILYYVSGNQQHFLEVNIKIILWAMAVSTIALSLFCAAGIAESIYYFFSRKSPRFLLRIIPYGTIFAAAVALTLFSRTVDLLSLGYP